jgi:ATP-dependent exoDNAse (exonuclease V) beta subunit
MLNVLYAHPRDTGISFYDPTHTYTLVSNPSLKLTSVTTVVKKWFPVFDADKILDRMKQQGRFIPKYGDVTAEQVKQEWKECGIKASQKGTRLHAFIEHFMNGEFGTDDTLAVEIGYFYQFYNTLDSQYSPYRTEWVVYDEALAIAGSIDMVFKKTDGTFAIFDWKCSKQIKYSSPEHGIGVMRSLANCNANHYFIQLNMYKYLIEKHYGLVISEMRLVILHESNGSVECIDVPDWKELITYALESPSSVE